jgi:hypothetical protein
MTAAAHLLSGLTFRPLLAAAAGAVIGLATAANGQTAGTIEPVSPPKWVVVTEDATPLRCGDLDRFYAVAELASGTILRQDGTSDRWARVEYPSTVALLIPANEGSVVNNEFVELTRESGLRAPSLLSGVAGSWRSVYEAKLPAGTQFKLVKTLTGEGGQVTGYMVEAPRPPLVPHAPRGFVRASALREATPTEIKTEEDRLGLNAPAPTSPATPTTTTAAATPSQPAGTEAPGSGTGTGTAAPAGVDTTLLQPITRPGVEPATPATTTAPTAPAGSTTTPAAAPAPQPVVEAPKPLTDDQMRERFGLLPQDLAVLDAKLQALQASGAADSNALRELTAEYERASTAARFDSLKQAIDGRLEFLRIRLAARDEIERIQSSLRESSQRERDIQARIDAWRRSRSFPYFGRVVRSGVYDGDRVPLMYRIESTDPLLGPRTVGYIRPNEGQDITPFVGRVVGLSGETFFDPSLRLTIIRPTEIVPAPEQP